MKASNRYVVRFAVLAVVAVTTYAAPASAMGRSSTPSARILASSLAERPGRVEAEQKNVATTLQSQVDVLRRELADLEARLEQQDVASVE